MTYLLIRYPAEGGEDYFEQMGFGEEEEGTEEGHGDVATSDSVVTEEQVVQDVPPETSVVDNEDVIETPLATRPAGVITPLPPII